MASEQFVGFESFRIFLATASIDSVGDSVSSTLSTRQGLPTAVAPAGRGFSIIVPEPSQTSQK